MDLAPWLRHVPHEARPLIKSWVKPLALDLVLKGARRSKNGDFRVPRSGQRARITINVNLPPYRFLLTLVHELAHFKTWMEYGAKVSAHGPEWKRQFAGMLRALSTVAELPRLYRAALIAHARSPKASVSADPQLHRVLCAFDPGRGDDICTVDDIPLGGAFILDGRHFEKISAQRTRCICLELHTGLKYHVYKNAAVESPVTSNCRE